MKVNVLQHTSKDYRFYRLLSKGVPKIFHLGFRSRVFPRDAKYRRSRLTNKVMHASMGLISNEDSWPEEHPSRENGEPIFIASKVQHTYTLPHLMMSIWFVPIMLKKENIACASCMPNTNKLQSHPTFFTDLLGKHAIYICTPAMNNVEGGGSSRALTRLHTMIGLTGYRTRDILRIRRALYRLTEKAWLTYAATCHICTKLRH
jgi:hypothetical protein